MVEQCSTQLDFDLGEQLKIEVRVPGRDEIERLKRRATSWRKSSENTACHRARAQRAARV